MGMFDSIKNKATDLARGNADKVEQATDAALDKAADVVDDKTGGKFSSQVQQGRDAADSQIGEERL